MALDGTIEEVPDTPANAAAFGRHQGARGPSAFPLVKGVYLVECGTHADMQIKWCKWEVRQNEIEIT
ncbi:MAG: hypothetical protein H6633_24925 [Anaerolineales bacterium]|nr:hypothetical protein [Anaerolineales bacterium]